VVRFFHEPSLAQSQTLPTSTIRTWLALHVLRLGLLADPSPTTMSS